MRTGRLILVLALLGAAAGQLAAQEAPQPTPKPPGNTEPKTDPTKPSPELKKALEASKAAAPGSRPQLASVTLKGRILLRDRPPIALIEVENKTISVNPGSVVTLGGGVTLKVLRIDSAEVQIEISPFNETIVLR